MSCLVIGCSVAKYRPFQSPTRVNGELFSLKHSIFFLFFLKKFLLGDDNIGH